MILCDMSRDAKVPIVGHAGVQYGLQAPAAAPAAKHATGSARGKLAMFQGSDEEDEASDRNAAVRAQQGIKRSQAKVRITLGATRLCRCHATQLALSATGQLHK